VTLQTITWRGAEAWEIEYAGTSVAVTKVGCNIASFSRNDHAVNPLWQPPWSAAHPDDPRVRTGEYGDPEAASVLATIVGWSLCIDRFGPPRIGESRPLHGEAGVATWNLAETRPDGVVVEAHLSEARLTVSRHLVIGHGKLSVETTVTNTSNERRDIEWAEHITLGDPLLETSAIEAGIDLAFAPPESIGASPRFPNAGPLDEIDPGSALAFPRPDAAAIGDIVAGRVVRGSWSVINESSGTRLQCDFSPDDFPWLCLWTEHRYRTFKPWNGETRCRGMELATKPFPENTDAELAAPEFRGRPTRVLLAPSQALTKSVVLRFA
jgi:hypothetical protein